MTQIKGTGNKEDCVVEYSTFHTVLENVPYAVMLLAGATLILLGMGAQVLGWLAAVVFVVYGVVGSFWIILFLCPHCPSYGQRSCPCGYGVTSARLRPKGDTSLFTRKFRQHIPVIVPLWFIPLVIALASLASRFTLPMAILLAAFVLVAFILVPWLSKGHGCKKCPQKELCPWMRKAVPG